MALKKTLTAAEHGSLDETLKGLYKEKDGKFHLDVDGDDNLAAALATERAERAKLEKQVKGWKALGKTEEEISELIANHAKLEEESAKKSGNWDQLRAQLEEKHKKELDAKSAEVEKLKTALSSALVDTQALAAIGAHKGIADLLLPHVRSQIRVVEEDGKFQTRVFNPDGTPKLGTGPSGMATIEDLVLEMKGHSVFGRAFDGEGKGGSGKESGNGGGLPAAHGVTSKSQLKSEKDRAAFVDKHGLEAYKALPT